MVTVFPAQIDTIITLPSVIDNVTPFSAVVVNRLRDAILAVETELGVKPSGLYTNVRTRLDTLENLIATGGGGGGGGGGGTVTFSHDIVGNSSSQIVIGLQGRPINPAAPGNGQALVWSGTTWSPSANFQAQAINTSGSLLAGPTTTTSIATGIITLDGKFIVNSLPTLSTLSDAGQGILYFDATANHFLVSENGGAYTQFIFSGGGDLTGNTTTQTVVRINGATVPVAGSLTTSTVLQVSGASALTYALIANANVSSSAAIAGTKIAPNFGSQNVSTTGTLSTGAATVTSITDSGLSTGVVHSNVSGVFTSSTIVDADVSVSAAIAGTKISPNFGSQNIITTGNVTLSGTLTWASGSAPATGYAVSTFTTDANYTAAASEYNARSITVTATVIGGLTATRNYILPLTAGANWIVKNSTAGGQDIQAIGSSGTGFNIPTGISALIWTDGTNFYGSSGSGSSGFVSNIVSVSTTYTVAASDELVKANTTGGAFTVSLPSGSAAIHKKRVTIKDNVGTAGTNNITVSRNGSTIDGATSNYIIAINYGSVTMTYDNSVSDWSIT